MWFSYVEKYDCGFPIFVLQPPQVKNIEQYDCDFPILVLQPPQFKLDPRLARILGVHTQTRPVIINALWQYIKTHKLQDHHEREYINCDKYLEQVKADFMINT